MGIQRLERHLAQQHVAVHDEIAKQAVERMLERGRPVFFEEKMPDPGKAVASDGQGDQPPPGARDERHGENHKEQGSTDEVQSSAGAVAVFAEVIRVELSERIESSGVFHDCELCGHCCLLKSRAIMDSG